jgi:hypothetical protein
MATFEDAGDTTLTGTMRKAGSRFDVSLSGTYNMVIDLEVEVGAKGSGAWELVKSYSTEDATVSEVFYSTAPNQRYRLILTTDTSGTCTAALTEVVTADQVGVDSTGDARFTVYADTSAGSDGGVVVHNQAISVTDSTLTLTEAGHAGRCLVCNRAAGITFTMPAATGTGNRYCFFVQTTVTSNDIIIQAASAADIFQGLAYVATDAGTGIVVFESSTTTDTITLNGSTQGGFAGDIIEMMDVAPGVFSMKVFTRANGTEASPFSAAVS